jgi:hypothetical protein
MKALLNCTLISLIVLSACSKGKDEASDITTPPAASASSTTTTYNLQLQYTHGNSLYNNIYVIWLESDDGSFLQNLKVCERLVNGYSLTNTALPYWKIHKLPVSDATEVSAVTGATLRNQNFSFTAQLRTGAPKKFRIFFETDRSFDANDWFTDQPAQLYSALIDLDSSTTVYDLSFYGWTPNEGTQNIIAGTPSGILQNELRYITNLKDALGGFGSVDTANSATNMVNKITLTVTAL